MAEESGNSGRATRFRKSLFYGKDADKDDDDNGGRDISGASDDSVDDPDYQLKSLSDSDDEEEAARSDNEEENVNVGASTSAGIVIEAESVIEGTRDTVGSSSVPRGGGVPRGRGRGRGRGAAPIVEKKGRKRAVNIGEWKEKKAKRLRNLGEEYQSAKADKKIRARRIGPPCGDGCFDKVREEARVAIFKNFWGMGDYDKQNAYISQQIRTVPVKRRRKRDSSRVNYEYKLKYYEETFYVCRNAFLSIHDISTTRLRLQLTKAKNSPTGTPEGDKRGRGPSARKITGIKQQRVHENISSLPTTSSHYTRAKSPHRKYLETGTTIKQLYEKYTFWMAEYHADEPVVGYHYYAEVFRKEYNIGVKPPSKDTCTTCDTMKADIVRMEEQNEDTADLKHVFEEHKERANMVQHLLSQQADAAPVRGMDVRVVCMDLQQTLPCPRMTAGIAYYKRKLWVYNFCIYDVTKGKASMFVWDEIKGGRGSDEVASIILKWVEMRRQEGDLDFDILRIFCDNCAGQNKNINVLLGALRIIHEKVFSRIELIFMVSGHSYMPCDRAFGVIEKKLRVSTDIMIPEHYAQAIQRATNPPYEVVRLEREDFKDIKLLAKHITKRLPPTEKFSKACQLVLDSGYKEGYLLKTDYDANDTADNTQYVRLQKAKGDYSRKSFDLSEVPLKVKYTEERLLNPDKIKDLITLSRLMPPASEAWTKQTINKQQELARQKKPVSREDDEDVGQDPDNDLLDYDAPVRTSPARN